MKRAHEAVDDRHFDPHAAGVVRRYLQSGENEGRLVFVEVERSAIVAVIDAQMGVDLPIDCVSQEDFESTINELMNK